MIYGILLAAGSSTRFGADKLLYQLPGGIPMGIAAARNLSAGVDQVVAVIRPGAERLADLLKAEGAIVVICPNADQGMGASLAWGVKATPEATGWLIALADMPFIRPATIQAIAHVIRQGAALAAPVHHGKRGHPVGFGREFNGLLSTLGGDSGACEILRSYAKRLLLLPCDDPGILQDIDKLSDLPASSAMSKRDA